MSSALLLVCLSESFPLLFALLISVKVAKDQRCLKGFLATPFSTPFLGWLPLVATTRKKDTGKIFQGGKCHHTHYSIVFTSAESQPNSDAIHRLPALITMFLVGPVNYGELMYCLAGQMGDQRLFKRAGLLIGTYSLLWNMMPTRA